MKRAVEFIAVLVLALAPAVATHANVPIRPSRPPLAACTARPPAPGQRLGGTVLQVVDGQTLCVALGPTPDQWVRVTIADAAPDTERGALLAAAFGRELDCRIAGGAPVASPSAHCWVDGVSVGKLLQSPHVRLQAADWR